MLFNNTKCLMICCYQTWFWSEFLFISHLEQKVTIAKKIAFLQSWSLVLRSPIAPRSFDQITIAIRSRKKIVDRHCRSKDRRSLMLWFFVTFSFSFGWMKIGRWPVAEHLSKGAIAFVPNYSLDLIKIIQSKIFESCQDSDINEMNSRFDLGDVLTLVECYERMIDIFGKLQSMIKLRRVLYNVFFALILLNVCFT